MREFMRDGGWMLMVPVLWVLILLVLLAEVAQPGPQAVVVGQSEKGTSPSNYKMAVQLDDGTVKVAVASDKDYYTVKPGTRVSLKVYKSWLFGDEKSLSMEVLP